MIINSNIKTLLEERSKKITSSIEFGLLIGQQSNINDEAYVLGFFPSPPQLSEYSDTNTEKKQEQQEKITTNDLKKLIDKEWILEFCFQVYRMLYGGISIVGFYIITPDNEILNDDDEFFIKLLKFLDANMTEPIKSIQFISYSLKTNLINGKLTNSSLNYRLKSTEIKIINSLENEFLKFSCNFPIDIVLHSKKKIEDINVVDLKKQVKETFNNLFKDSLFLIDNEVVKENIISSTLKNSNNNNFSIDILIKQLDSNFTIESSNTPFHFQFNSNTNCIAFAHKSEQVSTIYQYIKQDIIKSFESRLDIINDELLNNPSVVSNQSNSILTISNDLPILLPRRVNIQWIGNSITICDYLSNHDEINDCIERLSDLLQFDSPSSKIISYEKLNSVSPLNGNNTNNNGIDNNNKLKLDNNNNIKNNTVINRHSNSQSSNVSSTLSPISNTVPKKNIFKDNNNFYLIILLVSIIVLLIGYFFK
ncbi:hypothetical protein DICPUDRAFT_88285 [Dictyostelium purpureum]|uniref:Uncharacterized protein n=1 Tax=Dictyostelium purpureum TaxID=5786 RepID=F0ZNF7_DICPU|nr:uncharacterized protein DICPUDRAFT_88285 [Dictyostelium purpureum]EGC34506.1 hypothetical protein DICPUDRAFT_88285 [Dictyostelium purpureum]|eukprot:XP_003288942.1 hypothetical protein DICPUDRAFT_88285 [Dictyostelium purpureum]